ncbi:hypothetical protein RPPS3_38890 [Rhodopseudomonas palustris]|uniref:hypothetical protein n=1 Tax=Rhodopseudomonas palustris TaxID=1076 RepID=UPI000D1A5309|nr:hypothetical protein [Rhodopseudomonas palustris]AVT77951.1 hypothetical protein RPPS3_38890 [Rhodopseudomonas palustris]
MQGLPMRLLPALAVLLPLTISAAFMAPAQADGASSVYSSTAPKACRVARPGGAPEDSGEWLCPGQDGLVVVVSEMDLRQSVSVGRNYKDASAQPAAKTSFGPFNSTTDTVEWRLDGAGKPFAIIQRWHLADNDDLGKGGRPNTKQMLLVTRLPPGAVCHVAYVDVAANRNANEVARQAADELARGFACGKDKPKPFGSPGRATALVAPN